MPRLRKLLSRAESTWPFWAQVGGLVVVCFAVGLILGTAYGVLSAGLSMLGLGIVNEDVAE